MQKHAAPLIAAFVLLLPVLYVATYLAMVRPRGVATQFVLDGKVEAGFYVDMHYQACDGLCELIFWPLEQFDRKARPKAWSAENRAIWLHSTH